MGMPSLDRISKAKNAVGGYQREIERFSTNHKYGA
jgi:hypothetical protein